MQSGLKSSVRSQRPGTGTAESIPLSSALEAMPFPAFITDPGGTIVAQNAAFSLLAGSDARLPEDRASKLQPLGSDESLNRDDLPSMQALRGEVISNHSVRYTAPEGRTILGRVSAAPILDDLGRIQGALVTLQEVTRETKRHQATEASAMLARSLAQGGSVDDLLECLLGAMAHLLGESGPGAIWLAADGTSDLRLAVVRNMESDRGTARILTTAPLPLALRAVQERRIMFSRDSAMEAAVETLPDQPEARTSLFVPLIAQGMVIGVLVSTLPVNQLLLKEEISAISDVCEQFTAAIMRLQNEERTATRLRNEEAAARSLTWLRQAGELLLSCRDMNDLLEALDVLLRQGLEIDRIHLSLNEGDGDSLERVQVLDARNHEQRDPDLLFSAEQTAAWPWIPAITLEAAPYVIARMSVCPWHPEHDASGPEAVMLTTAIRHENRLLGALHVANLPEHPPIREDLAQVLRAFTQMLALALVTVRLVDSQSRIIEELNIARRREKSAAEWAAARAAQLEIMTTSVGEGVIIYDAQRRITLMNDIAKTVLGVKEASELPQPQSMRFLSGEIMPVEQWPSERALAGEVFKGELLFGTPQRQRRLWIICSPLRDYSGQPSGAVSVIRDITEENLVKRTREDFAATASHEMRTPLTAIIGFLELVEANWATLPEQRRFEMIKRASISAHRLESIVQNLLLISRLDAGKDGMGETLDAGSQVLQELVQRICGEIADLYKQNAIRIRCRGANFEARWPAIALERVLTNLLDNAAKYSPRGGLVTVSWVENKGEMVLRVRDQGPGVPAAGRERLFTRFGRVDTTMRAGRTGTGLGLYISRELITRMNGSLEYQDGRSGGACMVIRLPLPLAS